MFDLERLFSGDGTAKITLAQRQSQCAEDRRRDIYDSHRHRTFAVAYYMTGNEIEAENILTGTFVAAFSATEEPSAQDVDAALLSELRERFPLGMRDAPVSVNNVPAGSSDLSGRNILRTDLEEAIHCLPPHERLLFLLRDVEGYTPAAIAQLMQIPEAQVNRSLMSARIHLRRALAEGREPRSEAA